MAAKPARRWYQFSLRALLLLLFVSSIPPGVYVGYRSYLEAKRRAEIEASFRWLESLETSVTIGYVRSDNSTSFLVLVPSQKPESRSASANGDSELERADLRMIARQALDRVQSKNRDPFDRFGRRLSERGELFVLAWACWRQGHVGVAKDLYRSAEADSSWYHEGDLPQSLVERLAADFAHMETWRATVACGTQVPRPDLLKKFRRLQQHFPKSKHAPTVAEKTAIFESMVAEDNRHAQERAAGLPFEQLSQSDQIAELIFQLRDQNGHQWSQPGSCDVLDTLDGRDDSPGHRLLAYGYEAIPQLAAALDDERLTRSVGYHRDFYFSHRVLTVGDAAEQILERITSRSFDTGKSYESKAARTEDMQKNALAWHVELTAKGERACLVEAVEKADRTSVSVARRLAQKYPDAACSAILVALHKTVDEYDRCSFISMLGRIPSDESVPILVEELQHERVRIRVAAAQALTRLNRPEGIDALLEQWQNSQQIKELEGFGPFLARCDRAEAIEAVTKRFTEQSIEERMETMDKAVEHLPKMVAAPPDLRHAVVELLLGALNDTDVRSGLSGSRGSKSYTDPRVCDMAGYHLNSLDAATFAFDLGAPYAQREHERRAILAGR